MELCFEPKPIDEDIMVENIANRTENISKFEKIKNKNGAIKYELAQ